MSLEHPHVLWTSCNSNPYEVQKAVTQSRMLSGRFRDDKLTRHFSENRSGACLLCQNSGQPHPPVGDLHHLLLHCPSLQVQRAELYKYWKRNTDNCEHDIKRIVADFQTQSEKYKMQFLLDCSVLPDIIQIAQNSSSDILVVLFQITRTYCHSLHRERLKLINRWQ